eukprot:5884195-Pyramimonas_sp.AAC.1
MRPRAPTPNRASASELRAWICGAPVGGGGARVRPRMQGRGGRVFLDDEDARRRGLRSEARVGHGA